MWAGTTTSMAIFLCILALIQTFLSELSSLGTWMLREAALCFLAATLGLDLQWVAVAPDRGRNEREGGEVTGSNVF